MKPTLGQIVGVAIVILLGYLFYQTLKSSHDAMCVEGREYQIFSHCEDHQ